MNSEFQSLPPETQEAVKRTMDTMEPAQTPAEIRETLEGTQKGGVKNSIRNCLTVFQRDPLFRGALRLNLLTEQIDIVKPLGWERTSTTLTDMDMNYLLLYLEENYGLTSEKKVQSAIKIVANENRYHPVRDYLNSLQWDGTERIRYALHHFLGADTDEITKEEKINKNKTIHEKKKQKKKKKKKEKNKKQKKNKKKKIKNKKTKNKNKKNKTKIKK